jgi:hypothetical protein
MKKLLMTTAILTGLASPAFASNVALILWNGANPGDAEAASGNNGTALLGSSLDGITISASVATRDTVPNGLSEGNITITNTTNSVQVLHIIAGANGFLGPSSGFNLTGTIGVDTGSATLGGSFFVDNTNSLNGTVVGVPGGTDIGDFLSAALNGPHSFSFNGFGIDSVIGPYGLAESLTLTLQPFAVIGVQNVSMDASAVPEPKTWAMLGIGFGVMAFMGFKRSRKDRLATI